MCDQNSKFASFGRFVMPIMQGAAAGAQSVGGPVRGGVPSTAQSIFSGFGAGSRALQQQALLKREMEMADVDRIQGNVREGERQRLAREQFEFGKQKETNLSKYREGLLENAKKKLETGEWEQVTDAEGNILVRPRRSAGPPTATPLLTTPQAPAVPPLVSRGDIPAGAASQVPVKAMPKPAKAGSVIDRVTAESLYPGQVPEAGTHFKQYTDSVGNLVRLEPVSKDARIPTEMELRMRRLRGDPEATEILAEMQNEKIAAANAAAGRREQFKPATEAERKAFNFYGRAFDAHEFSSNIEKDVLSNMGLLGQKWELSAPRILTSETSKQYRDAQRAFSEARLRKESGAAVPQSEYDNDAITFFAQPGDSLATLKRKQNARTLILKGIYREGGRAMEGVEAPKVDVDSDAKKSPFKVVKP